MVIHAHKEQVVPFGVGAGITTSFVMPPRKYMAMQILFGYSAGVRIDFSNVFDPAQVRLVAGILDGANRESAVSVEIKILAVTVSAANSGVGCL